MKLISGLAFTEYLIFILLRMTNRNWFRKSTEIICTIRPAIAVLKTIILLYWKETLKLLMLVILVTITIFGTNIEMTHLSHQLWQQIITLYHLLSQKKNRAHAIIQNLAPNEKWVRVRKNKSNKSSQVCVYLVLQQNTKIYLRKKRLRLSIKVRKI